jgi:hypothetical protein
MGEVPLKRGPAAPYVHRGTSLIKQRRLPYDLPRTLGIGLR